MQATKKKKTASKSRATVASTIKKGHIISNVTYMEVTGRSGSKLNVKNLKTGLEFQIIGADLINECSSADVAFEEQKISRTDMAHLLMTLYNTAFTVNFDKKDGENRTLRGYLMKPEPVFGRSTVMDLEAGSPRLVDHRTLNWLIVNGVKYVC